MLLVLSLPPIVMRVALRLRGGTVVADGGIATRLVHVLMGIRDPILLRLRLMPCGVVVAATNDDLGHAWRYRQKCCQTEGIRCPHYRRLQQLGAKRALG